MYWQTRVQQLGQVIANNAALIQSLQQEINDLIAEIQEDLLDEPVEIQFELDSGFAEEFSLENIQN